MMARLLLLALLLGTIPAVASAGVASPPTAAATKKPHIMTLVIDDLGWHDTQIHNPDSFMTPNLGALAKDGITLMRHHTYKFCSPTRRSILCGRFPVHITGAQAPVCSNFLPLKFTLLPEKLKLAGYETHMVGKGHLGYQTMDHLPVNRGFDSHVGYLEAAEDYHWGNMKGPDKCDATNITCKKDLWHNLLPGHDVVDEIFYSANFYAERAVDLIKRRNASVPFYLHQTFQSVHGPFEDPPVWEQIPNSSVPQAWWDQTWGSMLNAMDRGVGNITEALRTEEMWDQALIVMTSDNGGDCRFGQPANNFPLKGRKCTVWEGGTRVAAFVSGGFIAADLRGTASDVLMHVADWYVTLSVIVGVDPSDPVTNPSPLGTGTYDVDGVNMWPAITGANKTNPRPWLPTTEDSILLQQPNGAIMKLIVSERQTNLFTADGLTQIHTTDPCVWQGSGENPTNCSVCDPTHPCLFNVQIDPAESKNLVNESGYKELVAEMAAKLASYTPYVDGNLTADELANYDCVAGAGEALWGNFVGPCCQRKDA
jgi:arylsulfatase B